MKKNLKRICTAFLTMALVMTIFPGSVISAGAASQPQEGAYSTSEKGEIKKTLNVAGGVANPDATFKFSFEAKGTMENEKEEIPGLDNAEITFSSDDKGTQTKYASLDDIVDISGYRHAGIYVYQVTETAGTYTLGEGEELEYDDTRYYMNVYIVNTDNGLAIEKVVFTTDSGEKVEQMSFENTYRRLVGEDGRHEKEGDAALFVSKTVTGDYGDKTKQFDFSVTIYPTSTNNLVAGGLNAFTSGDSKVTAASDRDGSITYTFTLAHGESFYISNLYAGTIYTVTEAAAASYDTSVTLHVAGSTATRIDSSTVENGFVGETTTNGAAYTNAHDGHSSPITGVIINNQPFVILIVVAIAGLAFYMVMKRRRTASL